jgi:RNA polymerase sigma-70 factor, ECF subfamily
VNYLHLTATELFEACGSGADAACWQEFINRFNGVIVRSVVRVAIRYGTREQSIVDDLVQETYLKICADRCKLIRTFASQSPESVFGFLKVVATNVAQDSFKARLAQKRAPESMAETLEPANATSKAEFADYRLTDSERAVLLDQIDRRLKSTLPPDELQRSRTVFWLYYRSGMTARAIASLPTIGLTTKGVESLLFRLTRSVRQSLSRPEGSENSDEKGFQQAESF